jgi:hypothetical protein
VESWVKRDHAAEWAEWVARCEHIAGRVATIAGVSAIVQREPGESLSNRSPRVTLRWDSQALGITGADVARILDTTEPRIALAGAGGGRRQDPPLPGDTGIAIVSAMMSKGDERIVADRVHQVLSGKHMLAPVENPAAPAGDVSGPWLVEIEYAASTTVHALHIQQHGNQLEGRHQGNFITRDISGTISGDLVTLASIVTERHGDALTYRFSGSIAGESMSGELDLGEYRRATWTARRPESRTRSAGL